MNNSIFGIVGPNGADSIKPWSPKMFTAWSAAHLSSGYILPLLILTISKGGINGKWLFIISIVIHTIYEIKDWWFSYKYMDFKKNPENKKYLPLIDSIKNVSDDLSDNGQYIPSNTICNCIGDTIAFLLGYYIFLEYRPISLQFSLEITVILVYLLYHSKCD